MNSLSSLICIFVITTLHFGILIFVVTRIEAKVDRLESCACVREQ